MKSLRRNSISWLLLAVFGVIAGGGRGLHFVPWFELHDHSHCSKAVSHCSNHSHSGHSHKHGGYCHSKPKCKYTHQQLANNARQQADETSKSKSSLRLPCDDHSH